MAGFFFDLAHCCDGNSFFTLNLSLGPRPIVVLGTVNQQDFDVSFIQHFPGNDRSCGVTKAPHESAACANEAHRGHGLRAGCHVINPNLE